MMLDRFAEVWEALPINQNGLSNYNTVILASMVESEARFDDERATIASVYLNRLEKNMLLQCDATILYAMPERKTQLRFSDYEYVSEYNTYLHQGLHQHLFLIRGRNHWRQPVSRIRQSIFIIYGIKSIMMGTYLPKPMRSIYKTGKPMDIDKGETV